MSQSDKLGAASFATRASKSAGEIGLGDQARSSEEFMRKFWITCSALALGVGFLAQASAQDTATSPMPAAAAQPAAASSPMAPTTAELTGQTIYDASGSSVGTISAVSTDASGAQLAVVGVETFLGMGGKDVLLPVSSLQHRAEGGFTTSLTSTEIKNLPEAKTDAH